MMVNCLICGRPTASTHLGIDACHACTVFYRRNRIRDGQLECVTGSHNCMDNKKTMISCRKCRLDRFKCVMRAGCEDNTSLLMAAAAMNKHGSLISYPGEIINRKKSSSIIERIRTFRGKISAFRRSEELKRRGIYTTEDDAVQENYEIVPTTCQFMDEGMRILLTGIIKFIPNLFPEFQMLSKMDKSLLIRNYMQMFHMFDSEFRSLLKFGQGSHHIFGSYTTFLSVEYAEHFFSDCPDQSYVEVAARTLRDNIQENILKGQMRIYQINPTEEEWMAMIGLSLWSVENIDPSEQTLALATRYRTEIIADLSERYQTTVGTEKGAARIGDLLCILQDCRRAEGTLKSEYEIYRMLDVMDDNYLMYKMRVD